MHSNTSIQRQRTRCPANVTDPPSQSVHPATRTDTPSHSTTMTDTPAQPLHPTTMTETLSKLSPSVHVSGTRRGSIEGMKGADSTYERISHKPGHPLLVQASEAVGSGGAKFTHSSKLKTPQLHCENHYEKLGNVYDTMGTYETVGNVYDEIGTYEIIIPARSAAHPTPRTGAPTPEGTKFTHSDRSKTPHLNAIVRINMSNWEMSMTE